MTIDEIELALDDIARELWEPDHERAELRARLEATYRRGRSGVFVIELDAAAAIDERNAIRALLDENGHRYRALRAERDRLRSELRRIQRQHAEPAKGRAA
ncbi:MAG: hypothetical protein ACK4MV_16400 [Beijerinckiaceae bacterium]